jgi:hypothetical protein
MKKKPSQLRLKKRANQKTATKLMMIHPLLLMMILIHKLNRKKRKY